MVKNLPLEIKNKLSQSGCMLADVGCGEGISSIVLGKAFSSTLKVIGYDYHLPSIEKAEEKAKSTGLSNVQFVKADAKVFGEENGLLS